jgi:hypothetical protein
MAGTICAYDINVRAGLDDNREISDSHDRRMKQTVNRGMTAVPVIAVT